MSEKEISRRKFIKYAAVGVAAASTLGVSAACAEAAVGGEAKGKQSTTQKVDLFFTKEITSANVMKLYEKVKAPITGKTLIKLHVGDPGNKNFIAPELVKDLCVATKATLGDSSVYYSSDREIPEKHKAIAKAHGFGFAEFDVLDEEGEVELPIKGGKYHETALMGSHINNYDSLIIFSHFKGHAMAGFGGALKNQAMGIASVQGKSVIHGGGLDLNQPKDEHEIFLESLADYGKALSDKFKGKITYITAVNKLSTSCDCDANAPAPVMADIGLIASTDLVAIEQAAIDLVREAAGRNGNALTKRIEAGMTQIDAMKKLGMGSTNYKLIKV